MLALVCVWLIGTWLHDSHELMIYRGLPQVQIRGLGQGGQGLIVELDAWMVRLVGTVVGLLVRPHVLACEHARVFLNGRNGKG